MCESASTLNYHKFHIRRTVKETNCPLRKIRIASKYMDKKLLSKLFMLYIRPKVICFSPKEAQRANKEDQEDGDNMKPKLRELRSW